ncbi:hypothetical protein HY380_00550 [Candidatus Saccharibacteria bacterium]|nr:hypothetical protein [Candidatus Saccharibacteria bacterium]
MSSSIETQTQKPESRPARFYLALEKSAERLRQAPDRLPDDVGWGGFHEVTRRAAEIDDAELDVIQRNLISVLRSEGLLKPEAFEQVEMPREEEVVVADV